VDVTAQVGALHVPLPSAAPLSSDVLPLEPPLLDPLPEPELPAAPEDPLAPELALTPELPELPELPRGPEPLLDATPVPPSPGSYG